MEISRAVVEAGIRLGYSPLKDEQIQCIAKFMAGENVFVILPTGYGKTACFACLPIAFDLYLNKPSEEKSIIIVVSPLTALIQDHTRSLSERNVSTGYIDADSQADVKNDINKGKLILV